MNIKDLTITCISCILYTFIPVGLWTNLLMLITIEYIPNLNQFWEMREHCFARGNTSSLWRDSEYISLMSQLYFHVSQIKSKVIIPNGIYTCIIKQVGQPLFTVLTAWLQITTYTKKHWIPQIPVLETVGRTPRWLLKKRTKQKPQ